MPEKRRTSFILLLEHVHTMEELTDEEFGQFIRAYAAYVENGTEPDFTDRSMRMMWKTVKAFDEMNVQKYSSTSEARQQAGRKGAEKRWKSDSKAIDANSKIANAILPIAKIAYLYLYLSLNLFIKKYPLTGI